MHHRRHDETQRQRAQRQRVAVFHLHVVLAAFAVETLHHLERLLVADYLHLRVVLADEGDGSAVVGLHVVHYEVVHLAVTDDLADVFQVLREEVHLDGIYEAHLLVGYQIRVIAHSVGQRPESFEK